MSDLNDEDYNGECFIVGASGEREEQRPNRIVMVPPGMPFDKNNAFDPNSNNHKAYLDLFYRLQYYRVIAAYLPKPTGAAAPGNIRAPDANLASRARRIAYIRTLAARNGNYDYTGTPAAHHTRYAEFDNCTWVDVRDFAREYFDSNTLVITDLATARAVIAQVPNHNVDANWRSQVRSKYIDIVCTIAYFFRVRGHHWTNEMDSRYSDVWRKCLYQEDNPGLSWEYLAHDSLHAIFPDDLDRIWEQAKDTEACAGTLIKRFDSLPAGVAGISALNAGVADLSMIVPKALDYSKDAMEHLEDLTTAVNGNRWVGSVNRRFYNAPGLVVDEAKLSALAAIIRAGLEGLAPGSPLLKSKALQRIAQNAQMTGAIVGKMVMTAVRSDAAAEIFLPDIRHTGVP